MDCQTCVDLEQRVLRPTMQEASNIGRPLRPSETVDGVRAQHGADACELPAARQAVTEHEQATGHKVRNLTQRLSG
jgi:hypothetical protein